MLDDESSKFHGKTKKWTEEQMEKAIQDVTTGALGVRMVVRVSSSSPFNTQ